MGTIYIQTEGTRISLSKDNLVIKNGVSSNNVPLRLIDNIVIEGEITLTSPIICKLIENNIQITFLNIYGGYKCSIHPDLNGNVVTRHSQLRLFDDENRSLELARKVLIGKCSNQIAVIDRDIRNYGSNDDNGEKIIERMSTYVEFLKIARDKKELMGYEGIIAKSYFEYFNTLIRREGYKFKGRNFNPPKDELNSALSYSYALLRSEIEKCILICGMDPYIGFLHSELAGKPALALDLMEEFRPFMCDRLIISMINNRQLDKSDFNSTDDGVSIGNKNRKTIIKQWESKKNSKIKYKGCIETYSGIILEQSRLMVKHIKGIEEYKPYLWR